MKKSLSFNIIILVSCLTLSGCVPLVIGAAAGAGGMAFMKGKLEKNFDLKVDQLHQTTLETLKELNLFVKTDELNVHSARVIWKNGGKLDSEIENDNKIIQRYWINNKEAGGVVL